MGFIVNNYIIGYLYADVMFCHLLILIIPGDKIMRFGLFGNQDKISA